MKKLIYLALVPLLAACWPEEPMDMQQVSEYEPILMSRDELANSIQLQEAREIKEAGKIYRKGHYLFINEKYEGIHVYNNIDPTNPKAIGFIKILGNVDMAMKNNIIYADNATDLIAIKYDVDDIEVVSRNVNVFPEVVPPDMGSVPSDYLPQNRPENTVIVKWEKK